MRRSYLRRINPDERPMIKRLHLVGATHLTPTLSILLLIFRVEKLQPGAGISIMHTAEEITLQSWGRETLKQCPTVA